MLIEGYDHGLSPQSGQRQIERVGEAPLGRTVQRRAGDQLPDSRLEPVTQPPQLLGVLRRP